MSFINMIRNKHFLTEFIGYLFDYENFHDYNYIFRISSNNDEVIIDIYDNISANRFNRYIFCYKKGKYKTRVVDDGNVFTTYIDVFNLGDCDNKLYKLAYMTSLNEDEMIEYAKTFLPEKFIKILSIIK